ncbi:hypothetical protein [Microcoleus sp. D3_18a_C4]|uniref:hypothetical protein n=1 Tax=unclassified Microcoleus TaxID=2642155 RepID=UPI002FD2C043
MKFAVKWPKPQPLKTAAILFHLLTAPFKHCKAIATLSEGIDLFLSADLKKINIADNGKVAADKSVFTSASSGDLALFPPAFIDAIMQHRAWMRTEE